MVFTGTLQIVRYPWAGTLVQLQANCGTARTADIPFYIDKMSKADYLAGGTTWTRLGGTDYICYLLTTANYVEYSPSDTVAITADDVLRITIEGTAIDNFLVEAIIENTIPA